MLFKSIQSITSIKSSTNTKVTSQMNEIKQSSNNTALLGLAIDLNPILGLGIII